MNNKRNYYRILHVQPDAPVEVIRASYRTLMQRLKQHPDLGGEHWNASLINEAHDVLVDEDRRRVYDRRLFGATDIDALSRQRPQQRHQRRGSKRQAPQARGWRPFEPIVID
ncbi:MAG: J domain-containing protein [Chromatiaceae bacterium]